MAKSTFETIVAALGAAFAVCFGVVVVPPLLESKDVFGAFAAGFVNPYASGYSLDVFMCAAILFVWIFHEWRNKSVKHGWIAIPIAFAPGVATALGVYLVLRSRQLEASAS